MFSPPHDSFANTCGAASDWSWLHSTSKWLPLLSPYIVADAQVIEQAVELAQAG